MKDYKLIDKPIYIPLDEYDNLIKKVIVELSKESSIRSIYQIGSIKNPGISDLDLVCVFHDNKKCTLNIYNVLNDNEKNILVHNLFGISDVKVDESLTYSYFTNFKLLYGEDLKILPNPDKNMPLELKTQIALEFLLKMFITLDIQLTYGIVKTRSFLLEAKAIIFDLELLSITEGNLYQSVKDIIEIRDLWFKKRPIDEELSALILSFHTSLYELLKDQLTKKHIFLPRTHLKLSRNIELRKNVDFTKTHTGFCLPNQLAFIGKKYINSQNRINKFLYQFNIQVPELNSIQNKRFSFYKQLIEQNGKQFPHFGALTTSLRVYYGSK